MPKMFAVQSNVIRGLTKQQYSMLREMCQYSNNLYNVALYNIRQYFFDNNKYLSYENNYQECRQNENYAMLQEGTAQQILRVADSSFRSVISLLKKSKNGGYDGKNIRIPHYRKKGGLFNLILSTNSISIKGGKFRIPMSREFMSAHPNIKPIVFPFPERLREKTIKEVRIIPFDNGRHFKIQYVYEVASEEKGLNKDNAIAIDLGVNNLATCVSTVGTPFIMDGRKLKSINHQWNREKARLQSVAKKQGKDITSRINRITEKRNNRVRDIIRKTARHIADYCIAQDIGSVYVGYNPDFKQSTNLGDSNNQNFVQIPFGQFRQQLSFLCWKYGIDYIEQEESYTSKSSVLDRDELPVYDPKQKISGNFSGQRIHRGLYMSKNGTAINADVNGSANILRKGKQNLDFEKLCMGLLASPERIRVL